MKTASNNVINYLNAGNQYLMAEIYTFALIDGNVYRYTSLDVDVSYNSSNYNSQGLLLKRSRISQSIGMEVSELEIDAIPTTANIGNTAWLPAVRNGALDGADVKLERLYYTSWNEAPIGAVTFFQGNVADIPVIDRTYAKIKVKDVREKLNAQWPLYVYGAHCCWKLYGAGCGLNRTTWTVPGTVSGNNSNVSVFNSNLAQANNYFDLGVVIFTSGNLAGARRTVKSFADANNAFTLTFPLTEAPANGVSFNAYPGCDHRRATCNNTYNNSNNFRGFPYIPVAEVGI